MTVKFLRRVVLVSATIALTVLPLVSHHAVADITQQGWLANLTPQITRIVTLPGNTPPASSNIDCYATTYGGNGTPDCVVDTALGATTMSSAILDGASMPVPVVGSDGRSPLLPLGNSGLVAALEPSPTIGSHLGIYWSAHKALLKQELISNGVNLYKRYRLTAAPDQWLADTGGRQLSVNPQALAVSENGGWMVADLPQLGLIRVNLSSLEIFPFAPSIEASWYLSLGSASLAISNDGRYVALSLGNTNAGIYDANLVVFDLSTCADNTLGAFRLNPVYCKSHDLWNGYYNTSGQGNDHGIKTQITRAKNLSNLRFVNDGNLSFNARYNWVSQYSYSAATFNATVSGASSHGIGLLGVGDSYISGEGEFQYVAGTDMNVNKCHLSRLAYPYLIGRSHYNSYESVACSGARTFDITSHNPNYKGQLTDHISLKDRQASIFLQAFLVGALPQDSFVSAYTPETVLVSIGGNDIDFTGIIKACAAPDTCYPTYEDRLELETEINNQFDTLVATYKKLKSSSPGARVYVAGYPQIVKPDGKCGLNVHLDKTETEFAAQTISSLDAVIERAAAKAGVFYVDTQDAFVGHRLCEAAHGSAAMNGLTAGRDIGAIKLYVIGKESYHPTVLGHELLASAIALRTNNLTAAMPAENPSITRPINDPNSLLTNAPKSYRSTNLVVADPTIAADVLQRTEHVTVTVGGLQDNTLPYGTYRVVLHSDPVELGTLVADANGDISGNLAVPATITPGIHTLHLYGKNMAGQDIDIQKVVFVAASYDDYNGDGISNSQEACVVVPASGQDYDKDGIDDACDADITEPPVTPPTPVLDQTDQSAQPGDSTATPLVSSAAAVTDFLAAAAASIPSTFPFFTGVANTTSPQPSGANVLGDAAVAPAATHNAHATVPAKRLAHDYVPVLLLIAGLLAVVGLRYIWRRRS